MVIRVMEKTDYQDLYRLWMSCTGMGLNSVDDSEAGIARFLNRNPDTCFAAVTDGTMVGAILAGNDGRRGYIYHMAVHPDHRRKGIGEKLVQAAMDALRTCGIQKAALVVFSDNQDGNGFWEHLGFSAREDLIYRNRMLSDVKR